MPGGPTPGELWRSREWRRLLNLIEHLPPDSYTYASMMLDENYVTMLNQAREARPGGEASSPTSRPSQAYWGAGMELLAVVADRLSVLIEMQSAKPRAVVPYPRPETAMERVQYRSRWEKHRALVKRVLPGRGDN